MSVGIAPHRWRQSQRLRVAPTTSTQLASRRWHPSLASTNTPAAAPTRRRSAALSAPSGGAALKSAQSIPTLPSSSGTETTWAREHARASGGVRVCGQTPGRGPHSDEPSRTRTSPRGLALARGETSASSDDGTPRLCECAEARLLPRLGCCPGWRPCCHRRAHNGMVHWLSEHTTRGVRATDPSTRGGGLSEKRRGPGHLEKGEASPA